MHELTEMRKAVGVRSVRLLCETVDTMTTTFLGDQWEAIEAMRTREEYDALIANL